MQLLMQYKSNFHFKELSMNFIGTNEKKSHIYMYDV